MGLTWDMYKRERPESFTDYDEPWRALSCGIVKQACDDYIKGGEKTRKSIIKFIQSDYFRKISNIDPDYLIKSLKKTYPTPRVDTGMVKS